MPKYTGQIFFFWRSNVHSAKHGQMHAAVTIMAANNHVPQFAAGKGCARIIFGK